MAGGGPEPPPQPAAPAQARAGAAAIVAGANTAAVVVAELVRLSRISIADEMREAYTRSVAASFVWRYGRRLTSCSTILSACLCRVPGSSPARRRSSEPEIIGGVRSGRPSDALCNLAFFADLRPVIAAGTARALTEASGGARLRRSRYHRCARSLRCPSIAFQAIAHAHKPLVSQYWMGSRWAPRDRIENAGQDSVIRGQLFTRRARWETGWLVTATRCWSDEYAKREGLCADGDR
jgi:hypothetical protein